MTCFVAMFQFVASVKEKMKANHYWLVRDERFCRRAGSVREGRWVPGDHAAAPSSANFLQCASLPEFATKLVCTSTRITSIWLFIPLKRFPEIPDPADSLKKTPATITQILVREAIIYQSGCYFTHCVNGP